MLRKYKLVEMIDDIHEENNYALIQGGHEVMINQTYRKYNFPDLVRHLGATSIDQWRGSYSPIRKVNKVYLESRTKEGILKQIQEMYPEYLV